MIVFCFAPGRMVSGVVIAVMICAAAAASAHAASSEARPARADAMAQSAAAFLATLSPEQRQTATRPFDDDAARTNWSNLPSVMAPRDGVALIDLNPAQRVAAHDMLSAAMSSQGYAKAASIMWIDDILNAEETAWLATATIDAERRAQRENILKSRDSGNYWIMVFGDPASARWAWMISGHHLAANFTVVDGRIAFTPLFVGAAPQTILTGRYAGWRVLDHEIDRAFALAASLSDEQRQRVVVAGEVTADLFTGKGRKDSLAGPVGMPASMLGKDQQAQLFGLIREFVGDAADEAAAVKMDAIARDGLGKIRLAWWGPTDAPAERFMYRIESPSILIEYAREPDVITGGAGNHVHAIVRDPSNDYGEDWLERHYTEQHAQ